MKIKINLKLIILFFVIILFFKPLAINSLEEFSKIDKLWDIGRILVSLWILYRTIFVNRKITYGCLTLIIMQLLFIISTIIQDGNIRDVIVSGVSIISFCLLLTQEMKNNPLTLYRAMFYALSSLLIIHTFLLFLYPDGLGYDTVFYNPIYFLSSKNGMIKYMFPAIISGLLMSELESGKIQKKVYFIITLCLYICIKLDSTTSTLGILACITIIAIFNLRKVKIKLDFQKIFLSIFLICILVTILGISGTFINILQKFVDNDKLSNYAERVVIWQKSIKKIENSPIIGYGVPKEGGHIIINGKPMYSHNGYLEILLYGGILGFIIFIFIMKKFLFVKSRFLNKEMIYIASGIIGFLIMMLTEVHINTISFWAFIIMYEFYTYNKSKKYEDEITDEGI